MNTFRFIIVTPDRTLFDGFVQELSSAKKDYVPEFDVSLI